jgi:hypothetical protein
MLITLALLPMVYSKLNDLFRELLNATKLRSLLVINAERFAIGRWLRQATHAVS